MMENDFTYDQALSYIHSRPRFSLPGGEAGRRTEILLTKLRTYTGYPDNLIPTIHVTGTNGKGSFSTMVSTILHISGKKTGLFISPYVLCYRERIQINGEMIPKETLARLVKILIPFADEMDAEGIPVNEFIFGFAMALIWFKEENCDIAVIEAGIGGAHDSTNALKKPVLSALMGIGLEHTAVLGDTLAKIAQDKSAIIKGNTALLYPEQADEVIEVVMRRCAETGAKLIMPSFNGIDILSENLRGTDFRYGDKIYHLSLVGRYQVYNAVMAITAAEALGVSESAIKKGIAEAHFPCRMELIQKNGVSVLIDGGHNVHGMTALAKSIHALSSPDIKPLLLTGMMRDKDFSDALACILPEVEKAVAVRVNYPRTASAEEIADVIRSNGKETEVFDDWIEGLSYALRTAEKENRLLLICGSLYLASDARAELTGERYE